MRFLNTGHSLRPGKGERSRRSIIVLLSILIAAAVGLSGFALMSQDYSNNLDDVGSGEEPGSRANEDSGTEKPSTTRDEALDSQQPGEAAVPDRVLAVSSDPQRLVRAEGTGCDVASPLLEVSSDGGATWIDSDVSEVDVGGVRQLQFGEGGRVQLAYVGAECQLQVARSYVYGATWENGAGFGEIWLVEPETNDGELTVAGRSANPPCATVQVSGVGERGIALCDDATVSVSEDAGVTWTEPVAVPAAASVVASAQAFMVVSLNDLNCEGVNARTFDGQTLGEPGECAEVEASQELVAAALGGGVLHVWAGEHVMRSSSGGEIWE